MARQVQIRGDTAANLAGVTPVARELIADTTNKRIGLGDGTNTGDTESLYTLMTGDLHKMAPIAATAGGTADALTATLDPAPAAYATHMTVLVKAANNNTGAATLNVNGLGAKAIKKNAGADDVEADDIVAGGIYLFIYDGTNFQVTGGVGSSAGGMELMGTGSVSSGVATVDIEDGDWSAYHAVKLFVTDIETANAASLSARLFLGGSVNSSSNYFWTKDTVYYSSGTTSSLNGTNAGGSFFLAEAQRNDNDDYAANLEMTIFDINGTTRWKKMLGRSVVWQNSPEGPAVTDFGGMLGVSGSVCDGIRLYASSGNINKLSYSLFGITGP